MSRDVLETWQLESRSKELNRRAMAVLDRLARRYESKRGVPCLSEVESALWRAGKLADRPLGGLWPRERGAILGTNMEHWTSGTLGWSFPCVEAVGLIRRFYHGPPARIIDVGAGCGLWTRVLMREFGAETVVGLDPTPKHESVVETTFKDWCEVTGGAGEGDLVLASWLPCRGQPGDDLGPQILDSLQSDQTLVYVGSGPNGPAGTDEFYTCLGREFEEYATEPLPRVCPWIYPRDFVRVFRRKAASQGSS